MKNFDYSVLKNYKFYTIFKPVARFILKLLFSFKVYGIENIPEKSGFILASNHVWAIDPVLLAVNCKQNIHFMAKCEAFKNPVFAWFMRHMNAFPVDRGNKDRHAVDYAMRVISEENVLGIFPEGRRSMETYAPAVPKAGIAFIAKATGADVLPACIYVEKKFAFRRRVTVRYGKLISNADFHFTSDGRRASELRNSSEKIFGEIKKLWGLGHGSKTC